jgi:hypothetical protein
MRTVDAELEVLKRGAFSRDDMHVDAENVAVHRQRIANAALAVEREACRQRMEDETILAQRLLAGCRQHLLQVVELDFLAAEIDRCSVDVAGKTAGRQIDDQALDRETGHALGRIDCQADDALERIEIGDRAGLDAARALVADADDFDVVRAAGENLALLARRQATDHADDLRRSDIEHGNNMRPLR